ncbi:MAG: SLBB domain-containing protein [bacterium]
MKTQSFFLCCFVIFTPYIFAQEIGEQTSGALEKPIVSEDYVLMPGDTLLITIIGATNYSYNTGITYEGKIAINVPVGNIPTAQGLFVPKYDVVAAVPIYGLSLKAARDSLNKTFLHYFRNVNIDITLLGMRTFVVFVAGEVKNPGTVIARPIDRVSEVIKSVGGTTSIGSRTKIELRRGGVVHQSVNLEDFERFGNIKDNPFVQDGDVIYVPKMEKSVIVKGAVFGKMGYELRVSQLTAAMERTSEGLYELNPGEKVLDLIDKAGGVTPWADLKNIYVQRGDKRIDINFQEILVNTSSEANIELQDKDVIVVPSVNAIVYVQGQVVNPGAFPFQPNLKASDYIGLAGGPLAEANMSGAYIVREKKKISVKKDPIIMEGDRIFVPRQIFKFWQDYVEIGSVAVSILISYLTLRSATK